MTFFHAGLVLALAASVFGCSSETSSSSSGRVEVSCRQKAGADADGDCAGHAGTPRKLDCDDGEMSEEAKGKGCVAEGASGNDVCCPLGVFGVAPLTGAGGSSSSSGGSSSGGSSSSSGGSSSGDGGSTSGAGGSSSSSGGASSGGAPAEHAVTCTETKGKDPFRTAIGAVACACAADSNAGKESYTGDACGQGDAELFCCKDASYPGGGGCDCKLARPWKCLQVSNTQGGNVTKCSCAFNVKAVALPTVSICDTSTTYVTHCCRDPKLPVTCECRAAACSADEVEITDCSTPKAAGFLPAPTACEDGKIAATTCSAGLAPKPPPIINGCDPRSCTGTDCVSSDGISFCCSYYCGNGCEQHCTD